MSDGAITQLTDKDLLPLEYRKEVNSMGFNNMKMYRKRDVERLSWTKYGGPNGLKAAYVMLSFAQILDLVNLRDLGYFRQQGRSEKWCEAPGREGMLHIFECPSLIGRCPETRLASQDEVLRVAGFWG